MRDGFIKVAAGTLRAAKKGRFIYTNKLFYKFYRFLAKVLPAALGSAGGVTVPLV